MVSKDHNLSVRRQCGLLLLARSNLYYQPKGESAENLRFMEIIDKQFLDTPWYGSRKWRVICSGIRPQVWPPPCATLDASDVFGSNLPDA